MKIRTRTQKYHAKTHNLKAVIGAALDGVTVKYKTPIGELTILRTDKYNTYGKYFWVGAVVGGLVTAIVSLVLNLLRVI